MTTVAVPDIKAALEVHEIPLEQLEASRNNPRQTMNDADLRELAASIRQHGIQNPLLVRPIDVDGGDAYKIVCGHRRSEAATLAGLTSVPCIVRAMDDATAAEIALVDNLQRVDVPPLEEAAAFGELLDRLLSIPVVAARVGKEQSYVAKRLRLRALTVWANDALRKGLITIDHALLLARLSEKEQNEALKWCLDTTAGATKTVDKVIGERLATKEKPKDTYFGSWEPESVLALKRHIEREAGETLDRAPWPLDSFLVSDEGPCSECPKNTKANAPLFADLAIGEPTCTDGQCFQTKTIAWVEIKRRESGQDAAKKKHVPRISWQFSSVKPATCFNDVTAAGAMATTADPSKVLKAGQWIEAKKGSCPNVRSGITVDWNEAENGGYGPGVKKLRKPGETLQVCIASGCKVHKKEYEKPKPDNGHAKPVNPEEEKRQAKTRECVEKTEGQIREKVFKTILDKLDVAKAVHMVADVVYRAPDLRKSLLAMFPDIAGEKLEAFVLFANQFHDYTRVNGYVLTNGNGVPRDRERLWKLAKSVGLDADAVTTTYFHTRNGDGPAAVAPAEDCLLPNGYRPPARLVDKAPVKGAQTAAAKPASKKAILSAEAKKRIAAAQKKRWANQSKK